MVRISTEIKRGLWRSLVRQIGGQAFVLDEALAAFQDQAIAAIRSGRNVISVSGAGSSTSFQIPQSWLQISLENIAALAEEFATASERVRASLIAGGNATPTDADISAEVLLNYLQPVTESYGDYSGARIASGAVQ